MKKSDTEQIRRANRKQIIDYLRVHGPIARIDVGTALNLSPATVTAITADLLIDNRIVEQPATEPNTSRGRPRVLIDLKPNAMHVLGVKFSINRIDLMLGDQKGKITKETSVELDTLSLDETALVKTLANTISDFIKSLPAASKPNAVGVAIQGVVNGRTGEIVWSPALKGKHIRLQEPLQAKLKMPVTVANDANCLTMAIHDLPKYQQLQNFCVIMLGYGVGMGMILNGELYLGHHGAASEFGHTKYSVDGAQCLCGKRGCIEAYVGDYALIRDASAVSNVRKEDQLHPTEGSMQALVERANQNDAAIVDLFDQAGRVLGYGISNIIALLSPEKVIISGPGVRAIDHLNPGIERELNRSLVPELMAETTVDSVHWETDMTITGVISLALQQLDS